MPGLPSVAARCRQADLRNGHFPLGDAVCGLVAADDRVERSRGTPLLGDLGFITIEAGGDARQVSRPQRRGLDDLRTHDRNAEQVSLELQEQVVGRGAAIDAQFRDGGNVRPP